MLPASSAASAPSSCDAAASVRASASTQAGAFSTSPAPGCSAQLRRMLEAHTACAQEVKLLPLAQKIAGTCTAAFDWSLSMHSLPNA